MVSSPIDRRISYSQRLFLWLVGYSLLMMGCVVFFQYHREKEFKSGEVNSRLQLINSFLFNKIEDGDSLASLGTVKFPEFPDLRISVLDSHGRLIYDNRSDTLRGADHSDRREIRNAMRFGSGYDVLRHSNSTGDTYFYSATKGHDGTIVRTAVPYSVKMDSLLKADYGFLWVMASVMLVMCIIGYFVTRRMGQHIERLKDFSSRVEKGLRVSDIEPFPHDELGEISNQIIRLYVELQEANAARDREHHAALRQQKEKEEFKKLLTNNINHELKTPVASVQICLETLIDHPNLQVEKRHDFLVRALSHCHRLGKLLADVAMITRIDDGGKAIVKEGVDLGAVIADCVAEKQEFAERCGFAISNTIGSGLLMTGNLTLLSSIFHNLIDNALAYSGGSRIEIHLASLTDDTVEIIFADNGSGIDPVHLPRIFERFYRIDKGRSRAAGGTGLGLSIVKNAVAIHNGEIRAENNPSGGLRFSIRMAR